MTIKRNVAVAGLGAIGGQVARGLDDGIPGLELVAVSAHDHAKASRFIASLRQPVPVLELHELATRADIVVECLPPRLFPEIATPVLEAGKTLVVLSVGALLLHTSEQASLKNHKGTILTPSGAIAGLDAVLAAAEGLIHSIRLISRKPPGGLAGAPYLKNHNIDVESIITPTQVFAGTAREAAIGFPANANVAAALSLAGIGPDQTMVEIWADPEVENNVHEIEVVSDAGRISTKVENVPSSNKRTSVMAGRSVMALLRKLAESNKTGT